MNVDPRKLGLPADPHGPDVQELHLCSDCAMDARESGGSVPGELDFS